MRRFDRWLKPTFFIDCDHAEVQKLAENWRKSKASELELVRELFEWCRDNIRFTPFVALFVPEENRASRVLAKAEGNCIQKAVLLCALLRACKVPARLAFADCINHQMAPVLRQFLGTNRVVFHGVTEAWVEGRWLKLAPAFDANFCRRNSLPIAEFDPKSGALVPERTERNEPFFEYLNWHESFDDLPFEQIVKAFEQEYIAR